MIKMYTKSEKGLFGFGLFLGLTVGVLCGLITFWHKELFNWIRVNPGNLAEWVSGLITAFGIIIAYLAQVSKRDSPVSFDLGIVASTSGGAGMFGQKTELSYSVRNNTGSPIKVSKWGVRIYHPVRRTLMTTVVASSNEIPSDKLLLPFTVWENRWSYLYVNAFQGYERRHVRLKPFIILPNGDEYSPFKKIRFDRTDFGYTPKDVKKNKKKADKDKKKEIKKSGNS